MVYVNFYGRRAWKSSRDGFFFVVGDVVCVCCVERIDFISEGDLLVNGVTRRLSDIIKSEVAFNVFMDH